MWFAMVEELRKKRKTKAHVPLYDHLDHIRVNFRNPTQHPDKTYDIDEVQDLWSLGVDVVNRMAGALSTDYTLADLDAGELEGGTLWTNVGGLTFTGPLFGVTGARDGNDGANQADVSGTLLAGPVADGETFCVRFEDPDDTISDHGLAIDDVTVTATEG